MKTLLLNELVAIHGGFDPLVIGERIVDQWDLELSMNQIGREQEAAALRQVLAANAD